MTLKQENTTPLSSDPGLILEVPTCGCDADKEVKIVLPLELATKIGLIKAIKSQNNDQVNQELSTLLQCIDVNRLLAVKQVVDQLTLVGFHVSTTYQNDLATHFSSHVTQIITNFQDDYSRLENISPIAIDRLIDKLVVLLSIYYMICLLGFAEFTTYSNLLNHCVARFKQALQSSNLNVQTEILTFYIPKLVEEWIVTPLVNTPA